MKIDLKELINFITEANKAGYASGQNSILKKESDGSTTITYQNGSWFFHDNYFGGEPYGGREAIFYNNKPVFIMIYYGRISDKAFDSKIIYSFLQKALRLFPEDKPFRGPANLEETIDGKNMRYENKWQGKINYFSGEEKIFINDKEIYDAKYAGGFVDQ